MRSTTANAEGVHEIRQMRRRDAASAAEPGASGSRMTPMHKHATCFLSPTITPQATTFLGNVVTSTHQFSTPAKIHRTSVRRVRSVNMVLGLRRIFAPSSRPHATETVQVIETPSVSAPAVTGPQNVSVWARSHPLQAASAVAMILFALRRFFGGQKRTDSAKFKSGASVASVGASSQNSSGLSSRARAIPKRHETTEEALDLLGNTARKYIIVGGKGGVGKTSMSAAVATAFADRGQTTLIVSTDPAHSLSDAFGQSVSGGDPVPVSSIDNLYAQEVDPDSMKRTFKMMGNTNNGKALGMDDMGMDELNSLFDTIPPGFDEAVALVEIVKYIEADAQYARFDRIVFDTAPTGHTLRLLALPDFLNGFFGKIISMKSKFGNVMNQLKGMFGNDVDMDNSVEEMEELKRSMNMVRELFRDEIQTEFIVATIPNMMAIAESQRLVDELRKEQIPVRHLFINQMQPSNDDCTFCAARYKEQRSNMKYIEEQLDGLLISTVQSFDKEIKGAAALRAMASQLFPNAKSPEAQSSGMGDVGSFSSSDAVSEKSHTEKSALNSPPVANAELVE